MLEHDSSLKGPTVCLAQWMRRDPSKTSVCKISASWDERENAGRQAHIQ